MSIETVAVVGCGQMGLGIAETIAAAGITVHAIRATGADAAPAAATLRRSLDRRVARGRLTESEQAVVLERVHFGRDLAVLAECDLVIESAREDLEEKKRLLQDLESHMTGGAILATNTSSLPLGALADALARPAQLCGLHFFNPAPVMELVEVGFTERTAPGVLAAAEQLCRHLGKTPVSVCASPGYVVNRLLVPYLLHAIETLESGIASAESIDAAMRLGCGHPMGPLALADFIGLDVVAAMAAALHTELGDSRYRLPSLLRRLIVNQDLGRKTGIGIYDYGGDTQRVNPMIHIRPVVVADAAE